MKIVTIGLCVAALLLGAVGAEAATPGELDTTFGAGGIRRTSFGDMAQADDLVVDARGYVYAAGTSTTGGVSSGVVVPVLAKYKPDGLLDTGFGSGGVVTPGSPPVGMAAYSALAIYQDTLYQMVAADDKLYVYAFSTAGAPQTWFGSGGVAVFTVGAVSYPIFDIAQWGNYLGMAASVVHPVTGNHDFVVVELNLGGAPVSSFGSGGIAYSRVWTGVGARNRLTGITFQPDGRIVAAGRVAKPGAPYDFVAARYRWDGTPDPTFGLAGFSIVDFGGYDFGRRVALRRDGSMVLAGSVCKEPDSVSGLQYCVAGATALKSDGSLDTGFGSAGLVAHDVGGGGVTVTDMILDERERPIVVGQRLDALADATGTRALVMRLKRSGGLDGSYLGGGWADFSYGYASSYNGGVKLYPGGRIVTAGGSIKEITPTSAYGLMVVARHIN
jgi:uncharacterized delta-60 repeat protein